jgi:hypothetical protein
MRDICGSREDVPLKQFDRRHSFRRFQAFIFELHWVFKLAEPQFSSCDFSGQRRAFLETSLAQEKQHPRRCLLHSH